MGKRAAITESILQALHRLQEMRSTEAVVAAVRAATTAVNTHTDAVVGQVSTIGTILDDDAPQTISIDSVSTLEGNVGTHMLTFTLTLDRTARRPISVNVRTVGGSARTPSDFAARNTVVTFAPGEQTATFDVPIVGDRVKERNESFSVRLSRPVNVRIIRGIGTGVIVNDD